MTPAFEPVDLRQPEQLQLAIRIGIAWIEMRRGASAAKLRDHLYSNGVDTLDIGQSDTLDVLVTRDAWRMSELAEALRVDPSTATRAVQRLVNVDLATRQPGDEDGRVVMVSASTAGRRRHAEVAKRRGILLTHLMNAFTPAERPQLADLLERFVGSIDDFVRLVGADDPSVTRCPELTASEQSTRAPILP
jgi:DNA-binding MarR family transcriptional regulator